MLKRSLSAAMGLLTLGVTAGVLAAEPVSAATFSCDVITVTASKTEATSSTGATDCLQSLGNPSGYAGSANLAAVASAGSGILRGGSLTSTSDHAGDGFFVAARSNSTISDRFVVSGITQDAVVLSFSALLQGLLDANASAPSRFFASTANSSFEFNWSLLNSRGGGSSGRVSGCAKNETPGISVCNGTFDYGPDRSLIIDQVVPLSVTVSNGDSVDLFLGLQTGAFGRIQDSGNSSFANSDFLHSVTWQGLQANPAYAGLTLTSLSGFDYAGSAFSGAVPEPATWAMMIVGFGLVGFAMRRRVREPVNTPAAKA